MCALKRNIKKKLRISKRVFAVLAFQKGFEPTAFCLGVRFKSVVWALTFTKNRYVMRFSCKRIVILVFSVELIGDGSLSH